jgi:hypothetical protein
MAGSTIRRWSAAARVIPRSWTAEGQVVWILGSGRSGSTWLLHLLARLTGAAAVDEPLIGAHLGTPLSVVSGVPQPSERLVIDASRDREDYVFAERHRAVWEPALRALVLRRFAESARTQGRGVRDLILVKEPNGSTAAPVLTAATPRSRLLFLVRDGRDVVDSALDGVSGGWITEGYGLRVDGAEARQRFLVTRAHQWVQTVRAVTDAFDGHDPARRLRVTYESLRADPKPELGTMLRWLGRDDAVGGIDAAVDALSFDNLPATDKGPGHFARAASPGLWRERFSPEEQSVLEDIMGQTLRELGYPE